MEKGEPGLEEVLRKGKGEYRVHRKGMYQRIIFTVKIIKEPYGEYPVLFTDRVIDIKEAVRLSEELNIPIFTPGGNIFPKGKKGEDFVHLMKLVRKE
ncbi:MAG: hypothetical protein NZ903_01145 [Candidatus Micrarchaeota archaeon]|nr:hypothetical protein [Candidatus Micrarchaeota archaeon]